MSAGRILVVDDDPQIRRVMRSTLVSSGYEVGDVPGGEEALEKLRSQPFDLILLDVNMPGMGGTEACQAIRASTDAAIIMLTVRNTEKDKVAALDAGADDYVTKPFGMPELLARIRAALRRAPALEASGERIRISGGEIDLAGRQVTLEGRSLRLTPKEFALISYLALHPNRTVSHRELLQAVWGPDYGEELEYLRVFINRLRKKIEPDSSKPRHLITDAWSGYRFIPSK
jgi:two-component system KDP operon response regulator KdpE